MSYINIRGDTFFFIDVERTVKNKTPTISLVIGPSLFSFELEIFINERIDLIILTIVYYRTKFNKIVNNLTNVFNYLIKMYIFK